MVVQYAENADAGDQGPIQPAIGPSRHRFVGDLEDQPVRAIKIAGEPAVLVGDQFMEMTGLVPQRLQAFRGSDLGEPPLDLLRLHTTSLPDQQSLVLELPPQLLGSEVNVHCVERGSKSF